MSPSVGFANQEKSCASQVYSDFPNTLSGCSSSLFWRSRSHFLRALRRAPSLRARRIAAIRQARRPSPMLRPSSPNPILPPCSLNQTLQPRRQTTTSAQAGPQIVCRGLRWRIIGSQCRGPVAIRRQAGHQAGRVGEGQACSLQAPAARRVRRSDAIDGCPRTASAGSTRRRPTGAGSKAKAIGAGAALAGHLARGPSTFFHACMPPWIWRAALSPAACAACTAMADRSPKEQ